MKQFLSLADVNDLNALVNKALELKKAPFNHQELGRNKTMVLLFLNPSLRTRLSTQKAAFNLGMNCMVLNVGQDGWNLEYEDHIIMNGDKAEHIKEAAAVISSYADVIGMRTFAGLTDREKDYSEFVLSQFNKYATVPLVNMESATLHPLQSLTDVITIEEFKKTKRPKVVLSWAPHPKALPQAVANSFVQWMQRAEVELIVTHPKGYELAPQFIKNTKVEYDQNAAFEQANFVYAKNWSAYEPYGQILSQNSDWTISMDKMKLTNNAYFMHCLPVRRNVVVREEVLDSPYSIVQQQAANREWAAQAVLHEILKSAV
jgi:N-succinyl-L-ornithine transcarbamylase